MANRLGREDWLLEALRVLAESGVEAVRVEPLAKRLGVTQGSFYWAFGARAGAQADDAAPAVLRRVDRRRVAYLRQLFVGLGFSRPAAQARAQLIYSTLVGNFELGVRLAPREQQQTARPDQALRTRPRRPPAG